MAKKWYRSRTLWVNTLMAVGILVQQITGQDIIDKEAQAAIVVVVNIGLRVITKEGLE